MKSTSFRRVFFAVLLTFIFAGLVLNRAEVQAGGGGTTVRVYIKVSRDWLNYGHIKVKKVKLNWQSSGGMHNIFTSTDANFNTDDFEAGFVRYTDVSATFYSGRYRDFGISGSAEYPYECTIEYDVITYNADKQAVVKTCCLTRSATISSGTDFTFEWPNKM